MLRKSHGLFAGERFFGSALEYCYLFGIHYKEKGELDKAATSYETAIANYPSSDKYHLNETWNNLGTVRFDQGDYAKAKGAWEKALTYMPSDRTARANLVEQ